MSYREDLTYKTLERLCTEAGIKVRYRTIPDDTIDGELWARSHEDLRIIEMPDSDCFDNDEHAGLVLGHELAHFLTGLDSPDRSRKKRVINEAVCDLLGAYLYELADMIAGEEAEQAFIKLCEIAERESGAPAAE